MFVFPKARSGVENILTSTPQTLNSKPGYFCRIWNILQGSMFFAKVWLCPGVALVPLNLIYPMVPWSSGPLVLWSCGLLVLWCGSPVVHQVIIRLQIRETTHFFKAVRACLHRAACRHCCAKGRIILHLHVRRPAPPPTLRPLQSCAGMPQMAACGHSVCHEGGIFQSSYACK